jgi:hypothetical protein
MGGRHRSRHQPDLVEKSSYHFEDTKFLPTSTKPVFGANDTKNVICAHAADAGRALDWFGIVINQSAARRTIMKVFAIGNVIKPMTDEDRKRIMPDEVRDTLQLYLDGKIEQFWIREDKPGVVFLINADSVEQAKKITDTLPLVPNGFLAFDIFPVGPLAPLGLLIQGK